MPSSRQAELAFPGPSLPPSTTVRVRAEDGTRLHTEVFGPEDGYPIVLAHGITCSLRVWHEQINDCPAISASSPTTIAATAAASRRRRAPTACSTWPRDLDAVLAAHAASPGTRPSSAGTRWAASRSSSWADRFRHRVENASPRVALINTTTGDLLAEDQLLRVPGMLPGAAGALAAQADDRGARWGTAGQRRPARQPIVSCG